jgi:glycosyltransferase
MKVTIITAVFNGATTLENTIKSILSQSHQNIEYIVVDGASTDRSVEIANRFKGERCSVISEKDQGFYDALNKGIAMATGEVVGFLNADDTYATDDVIAEVTDVFLSNSQLDCVYGDLNYVRGSGGSPTIVRRWVSSQFRHQKLYFGWMPPHPTVFLRRRVYEKVGGFDVSYKISGDYDFILRSFGQQDFRAKYIPKLMVNMQLGGISNRSLKNILIKMAEDYRSIKQNQLLGVTTLVLKNVLKIKQLNKLRFFKSK